MKFEKSCGCVIINDDKVLLVKQVDGHWGFPKGHVEENETEEETAIREVYEETNLQVEIFSDFYKKVTYSPRENVMKDVIFFLARPKNIDTKPQETEISKVEWVSFDEALNILTYEDTKNILKEVLNFIS